MKSEVALAEAVIRLAVNDVLRGTAKRRDQARADIAAGCLDYWVEVVSYEGGSGDALRDALRGLIACSKGAA